jgi:hypothetical protein
MTGQRIAPADTCNVILRGRGAELPRRKTDATAATYTSSDKAYTAADTEIRAGGQIRNSKHEIRNNDQRPREKIRNGFSFCSFRHSKI